MFWKTYEVLSDRLDYTKNSDGSWTAQLSGRLEILVVDSSLERCRQRVFETLDEQGAAILTGPPSHAHGTQTANESGKHSLAERKRKP
jgi:hypothetical protein